MSVKIRLRRMGKKKQPHYRIVVADSRSPRDGRFVENVGYYNPLPSPAQLKVDLERVDYWLGEGAITSPTVGSLVSKARGGGDDKVALVGAESAATVVAEAVPDSGADGEAAAGTEAAATEAAAAEAAAAEAAPDSGTVVEAAAETESAAEAGAEAGAEAATDQKAEADTGAAADQETTAEA